MFSLVFVILSYNAILAVNTGYPATIHFEMTSTEKGVNCKSDYIRIMEGESLFIKVENIYTLSCEDLSMKRIIYNIDSNLKNVYLARVDNVSTYKNKWICKLSPRNIDPTNEIASISCSFKYHLRTTKPTAQLSVNKRQVVATTAVPSIWQYDAVANYSFEEEETVVIDCGGPSDSGRALIKIYSGRYFVTQYINKQESILLKLSKEYDKRFVDCVYDDGNDVSNTRLYLYSQDPYAPQSIITLHINGMKIRTNPYNRNYNFHVYYEEEETRITCENRNANLTLRRFYKENWERKSPSQNVNETLLLTKEVNMTMFACDVIDDVNNTIEVVIIQFIKSADDFYVTGLLGGNILKQYSESWNSILIYYQYTDGEQLNLTCTKIITRSTFPLVMKFTLNGNEMKSTVNKNNEKIIRYHVMILRANNNNSDIKCMLYVQDYVEPWVSITVRLLHKKALGIVTPNSDDENNNDNNDKGKNNNETDVNGKNDTNVFTTKQSISLSVGIGTLIIILIIIAVIVRNKRNKEQISESNYMNVPNRGALPSSANENRELQTLDDQHYQNRDIDHDQIEPVLHYAEIMPTKNRVKFTKEYAPEYAQIKPKVNQVNNNENYYENLCSSASTHVNGEVGEDPAEPTYSEVISSNK